MEMLKILSAIIYYVGLVIVVAFMHKFMWFLCVDIIIKVAYVGGSQSQQQKTREEKYKPTKTNPCPTIFSFHLSTTFWFGPQWFGPELEFKLEPALQLHLTMS